MNRSARPPAAVLVRVTASLALLLALLPALIAGLAAPAPASTLSGTKLAKRGDAICREHSRRIADAFERMAKKEKNRPTRAKLVAFVRATVVPEIRASLDEVARLPAGPVAVAALADAVAAARAELRAVERDPGRAVGTTNPFPKAAAKFKALGFTRCAQ